jgi:hypothetical protein
LLKAFGDDVSVRNKIANMRVLDGISARVHNIDTERESMIPDARSHDEQKKMLVRPFGSR